MPNLSKLRAVVLPSSTVESVADEPLKDYLSLLDSVPFGLVLMDKFGVIQACNAVGRRMFQYRNIDMLGMESEKLLIHSDRDSFNDSLQSCLRVVNSQSIYTSPELEGLRKDCTSFPVEIHMKSSFLSKRELIACTFRDITKRRCNEAAIRKKEEKLQLALQGAELWIWEFNYRTNAITYEIQNSAYTGISKKEINIDFKDWLALVHPDYRKVILNSMSKLASGESKQLEFEYKIKRKNGCWDWIYSCGKVSKYDKDGVPELAGGTNLNISERKYAQERLQKKMNH